MKLRALLLIGTLVVTSGLVTMTRTGAATTTIDLSMKGGTVAGYTKAQPGQELPFSFQMTNNSTSVSATDVSFTFTLTHASANGPGSDYVCPLTSNHYNIFPDTPACEPGGLGATKSTSAAIMVNPTTGATSVTVKACASLLDGHSDPVSANNCKTVTIPIG